jgi:hypothetical protein
MPPVGLTSRPAGGSWWFPLQSRRLGFPPGIKLTRPGAIRGGFFVIASRDLRSNSATSIAYSPDRFPRNRNAKAKKKPPHVGMAKAAVKSGW